MTWPPLNNSGILFVGAAGKKAVEAVHVPGFEKKKKKDDVSGKKPGLFNIWYSNLQMKIHLSLTFHVQESYLYAVYYFARVHRPHCAQC